MSEERIQLLRSWRRSGFSVDQSVRIPAGEKKGLEDVARYMLRTPVSLSRMRWNRGDKELFYVPNTSHNDPEDPSTQSSSSLFGEEYWHDIDEDEPCGHISGMEKRSGEAGTGRSRHPT